MPGDGFSYSKYHERAKRFHSQQTRGRRESEREHDPHHNYYRYSKYTYYSSSTPRKEREKQRERKAPWSESTLRRKELGSIRDSRCFLHGLERGDSQSVFEAVFEVSPR